MVKVRLVLPNLLHIMGSPCVLNRQKGLTVVAPAKKPMPAKLMILLSQPPKCGITCVCYTLTVQPRLDLNFGPPSSDSEVPVLLDAELFSYRNISAKNSCL